MRPSLNSQSAHQQHKWHVIHEFDTMKSTQATNERDKYLQNHEQRLEQIRANNKPKKTVGPFIRQALLWSSSLHPHEIVVVP
jgi:hypothetical protein